MGIIRHIFKMLLYLFALTLIAIGLVFVATGIAIGILNCIYIYG